MIPLKRPKKIIDSGIYLISKSGEAQISFQNLVTKSTEIFDFVALYPILFTNFPQERVDKIVQYITEGSLVMIDFDKELAYKLQEKEVNYVKVFWKSAGTTSAILNEIEKEKFAKLGEPDDINERILTKFKSEEI